MTSRSRSIAAAGRRACSARRSDPLLATLTALLSADWLYAREPADEALHR